MGVEEGWSGSDGRAAEEREGRENGGPPVLTQQESWGSVWGANNGRFGLAWTRGWLGSAGPLKFSADRPWTFAGLLVLIRKEIGPE